MTLQEAIKKLDGKFVPADFQEMFTDDWAEAIATILNAVVKGELKA